MKIWIKCVFLTVALIVLVSASGGQQPATTATTATKEDFSKVPYESLLRERDTLSTEIEALTGQIGWVNDAIAKREDMKRSKESHKPTDEIEKEIRQSISNASIAPGTALDDLDKQLDVKQKATKDDQQRKALIDAELFRRADVVAPQIHFKLEMSITFAILVGFVIIGFFVMAGVDEDVRREIFSGQFGIQFVTLFSLVIAIILFGIVDILEGKELAALLGGLSGYILGRTSNEQRGTGALKAATPIISSINPTNGPVGASVVVTGTSLAQPTQVTFGGAKATSFTADSDTQVTATVPTGAKTGKISVTTPGGTAQSATDFTVT